MLELKNKTKGDLSLGREFKTFGEYLCWNFGPTVDANVFANIEDLNRAMKIDRFGLEAIFSRATLIPLEKVDFASIRSEMEKLLEENEEAAVRQNIVLGKGKIV